MGTGGRHKFIASVQPGSRLWNAAQVIQRRVNALEEDVEAQHTFVHKVKSYNFKPRTSAIAINQQALINAISTLIHPILTLIRPTLTRMHPILTPFQRQAVTSATKENRHSKIHIRAERERDHERRVREQGTARKESKLRVRLAVVEAKKRKQEECIERKQASLVQESQREWMAVVAGGAWAERLIGVLEAGRHDRTFAAERTFAAIRIQKAEFNTNQK